jgi:hypothetical protein
MKKLTLLLLLAACGSDNKATSDGPVVIEKDAAIDGPPSVTCFSGTPTTHDQLINACVDENVVTRIVKNPTLPLLHSDGTLPPLP